MSTSILQRGSAALPTELFRLLADTSPVGIALYARDRVLYVNPAMETITGFAVDDLLGMSPLDPVHPDDRGPIAERLEARLRGERPAGERFEIRFLGPKGEERWVEVAANRIELEEADGAAILATIVDVTDRHRAEAALRESQERLDLAQSAARYVTWEWNLETDELLVDDKVEEIYGVTAEQVGGTGQAFLELVHPDDRHIFAKAMEVSRDGRADGKFQAEVRFVLPGGETRWVGERARLLPAGDERPARVIGVATDIDERKRMEIALSEEKERAQITLESIGDGVIRTDAEGCIDYMNVVAERLTGWTLEQAAGRPLMEVYRVVDEATRKSLADPLRVCLGQRRVVELPGSSLLVHRQGREYSIQDSAAPIITADDRLTGAVLVFKDVTHERGMEREVSYLVTHDPLTGLINRHEFERRVGRMLDQAHGDEDTPRHGLCYLDLDEFKLINDTCGHLAGDELLQQIADRMTALVPPGSTLARLGGDEFGVLLENMTAEAVRHHARELRDAVRELRFEWQGRPFSISVSVGLVLLSGNEDGTADVLSAADAACHMAKEEGHSSIHEYRPEDADLAERYSEMHWVHRIQKALDEDRFCLHRQRIEPLGDGQPLAEVFIRMRGEDGELIPPGRFIPAAERFHLIPSVDRWVVRTALRLLAADEEHLGVCHALNLSGQSLGDEAFLDAVVEELEASGLDPTRICFEITETAAVTHLARANRFISVLRRMGCHFILDDFGSGLSSFAYLKNLQVDYLKVSGEFVRGLTVSDVQMALVRSIHELGSLMGMRTIAEGVETERELETVRGIGFDYAQGYWIERPHPM